MSDLIFHVLAWPTLGVAVLVFGFAPGVALRLILLFYPRGNLRRQELLGELYAVPRIERPFWVAEQLEVALFEGLRSRFAARRAKRASQRGEQVEGSFGDLFEEENNAPSPIRRTSGSVPVEAPALSQELRERMRAAVLAERDARSASGPHSPNETARLVVE